MPRFPVTFRRRSTAEDPNGPVAEHSFRVLERNEVSSGKSFDGGARLAKMTGTAPKSNIPDLAMEDNLFAGVKNNRYVGSGSSNTTKTASDNSSRHSNASTAPSSTDFPPQDDWRNNNRKSTSMSEGPAPSAHKNSGGFLKQAGRTFSFGNRKHTLPTIPAEESVPAIPAMPEEYNSSTPRGRSRAETASTVSTATPPQVEDRDFMLDLGGDLSSMLKFDKRASVATVKERLMANRVSQPSPLHLDNSAPIEPPQHSWNSQHSTDGLLNSGRNLTSPPATHEALPPPVPRHGESPRQRRHSDEDDEDTILLKDSIAATQFLYSGVSGSGDGPSQYSRDEDQPSFRSGLTETYAKPSRFDAKGDDDNMFDRPVARPKFVPRLGGRANSQPQNKVMTPEEFEKYRQDKAREEREGLVDDKESDKEDEDNYDDDEDEREKTKQLAKQRRKQEAHMTVYRQQMMKVTGESSTNTHVSRPSISGSMSTPNLMLNDEPSKGLLPSQPSDGSDSDEEVPLAILAAHGFPNKNRPPTRLTNMSSNPNLRASVAQPAYASGPGSNMGGSSGQGGGNLPPFARKLPQDPYIGAGLINQPPRESFALGGGAAAPVPSSQAVPTGGLVGVIANEERSRALRRGSPAIDTMRSGMPLNMQNNGMSMNGGFDHIAGIPPQMMYPSMPPQMFTPNNQTDMAQQMQHFLQMQMQMMQQMMGQKQGQEQMQGSLRPQGHMPTQSMGSLGDMPRNSFMGDMMGNNVGGGMNLQLPRADNSMRTMSMVQPSSASWLHPPPRTGYAPSIHAQGGGYAPSIAPSERSNIGLPGRYRPVSSVGVPDNGRTSTMSDAMTGAHSKLHSELNVTPVNKDEDDDDEQGWEAMKAKREKKKNLWRTKKSFGNDIGALIS
ncbi:hypothetical protein M426DRAFT_18778 [Hypoxylon sp. CI-4A]|nr:hypothetical protein M426DRAFT_18778 [Hypoxylon sp. CI-4A]